MENLFSYAKLDHNIIKQRQSHIQMSNEMGSMTIYLVSRARCKSEGRETSGH